jgi:hypothetical protein
MPGSLDTVLNDLAGKFTKYAGDYGVVTRFLSRIQNGIPGIAIISALISDIRANGGYVDIHGGVNVSFDAQAAELMGVAVFDGRTLGISRQIYWPRRLCFRSKSLGFCGSMNLCANKKECGGRIGHFLPANGLRRDRCHIIGVLH